MINDEHTTEIETFLGNIPDRFIVTRECLDDSVYEEYLRHIQEVAIPPDEASLIQASQCLFDTKTSELHKQGLLAQLALLGTVQAYRIIEKYVGQPDPALAQWSKIALYECRMTLENELLEQNTGIISTGLGGEQHRLRYMAVTKLVHPVLEEQRADIKQIWDHICQQEDSRLEQIHFDTGYLMVTILVSMEVAVGKVIEESITMINREQKLVYQHYFVTNVAIPTHEEIQAYLNEVA